METLMKDIRYGVRSLLKRPGFAALAVMTLALGIGASTAIFSVVDGVLLRSLPYPQAERIVQLREINEKGGQMSFAEPNFLDVRDRSRTLEAVAQYSDYLTTVTGGSEPVRAMTVTVSAGFFNVLGTQPFLGRTFTPGEGKRGEAVVVISYGFWQRLLGGPSDLSNTRLNILEKSCTVVGVMPPGFDFPAEGEVWIPRELFPGEISRSAHNWNVIARLKPGVELARARAELSNISKQLRAEYGKDLDGVDISVIPQQDYLVGNVRGGLFIMLGAVGFLLAVACANVANLLLAQLTARQREFAVRTALGATRLRLARQFITENLLLSLAGGGLGVLFSFWAVHLLLALNQTSLPRANEVGIDARAVVFTIGLSILIAVVLGLVPIVRYSSRNLETSLRVAGRGQSGPASQHLRNSLVVAQIALTLILLVGAGLLGKSFYRLLQIDPGFRTETAVAMEVSMPSVRLDEREYKEFMKAYEQLHEQGIVPDAQTRFSADQERQGRFRQQLLDRLTQMPGVVAAGSINRLPLTGDAADGTFFINNNPAREGYAEFRVASADYFSAMGIPLLRGRTFTESDQPTAPNAAVVSQSLAQKYWPNEDPIGQAIQFGNMDGDLRLLHIVGVVGDVHAGGIDTPARPTVYANALQRRPSSDLSFVVRAVVPPSSLVPAMRQAVKSLDAQLPIDFRTLDQIFSSSLDQRRFSLVIFSVFGAVALLLAAMGIYGVTTYAVAQRTQEIGIRMALGARMSDVLKMILRSAMMLALVGAAIGVAGALALTRLMSALLFGVTPTDLPTFALVAVCLIAVALIACYLPARRATKVDPLVALRYE
jgi:ABC-type antimicrobial peptide transport system permease subunit